jgi:hypothetical protein
MRAGAAEATLSVMYMRRRAFMIAIGARKFAAAVGTVALLAVAGAAPATIVAATLPTAAPASTAAATIPTAAPTVPHQYVGYGYYGFPSPSTSLPWQAVNYPGSGASAWLGFSAPYSSAGYPYGGYAQPYVAYAYPYAVSAYGAGGSPYSGSPSYPYTGWGASYGNAYGPTAAAPSGSGSYWDNTGYYVVP